MGSDLIVDPIEPGEDEATNPYRYGKQLAHWLRVQCCHFGYQDTEVIPEDWGWCVVCARDPILLWIGCGNRERMEIFQNPNLYKEQPPIWECFAVAEVGFFKRSFKKMNARPSAQALYGQLIGVLRREREIQLADCEGAYQEGKKRRARSERVLPFSLEIENV